MNLLSNWTRVSVSKTPALAADDSFLCVLTNAKGEVCYIGETTKLRSRMASHKHLANTTVSWQCHYILYRIASDDRKERLAQEATLIKRYKPKLNRRLVASYVFELE